MKPLPIRLRLTIWYFVLFTTAALLLSLTSWWMLRRTIDITTHQELLERTDDIRTQLKQLGLQTNMVESQAKFDSLYRYRDDGKWIQILDQKNHWVYRSARMAALNSSLPQPQSLSQKGTVTEFEQGTRFVRTLSVPLIVDGHSYSVETGIAMNKPLALLHHFGVSLLLLTPAVVVAAAIAGHFMSRKALAPVAVIAQEARRINEKSLDTRLPVSATNDELSHLSVTLNNMLARIDASFKSVRDFTANASHELRTPLACLRTEIEVALFRPRGAGEYRESLKHMHRVVIDMSGLIDSLLAIARSDNSSEVLHLSPVDLRSLVEGVAEEWRPIADRLLIRLETPGFHGPSDQKQILVLCDRLSILRLFRALLDNALKFTPSGGTVRIVAKVEDETVLLAVADTGIGIAPEHQSRIFDRFYRVKGDAGGRKAGAGLGLSLAAWIATQHKTSIAVESTLGRGSCFQVSLSRVHQDEEVVTQRLPNPTKSDTESYLLENSI